MSRRELERRLLREGVDEESSIEQHVDWIADCIAYLRAQGRARIEATPAAEDAWPPRSLTRPHPLPMGRCS